MSGTFPAFPELQALIESLAVQPGQSTLRDESDETIRARNASVTPIRAWKPDGDAEL